MISQEKAIVDTKQKEVIDFIYRHRIPCGSLRAENEGEQVHLVGWAFRYRDQGGIIFVDLRDRSGIVQIVFEESFLSNYELATTIRYEYVLAIKGKVKKRSPQTINPKLPTGEVEVFVEEFYILNTSKALPFGLDEYSQVGEEVRLKYRYLDLRRDDMQKAIITRSKLNLAIRKFLDFHNFLEIETPILNKSTPEGARDFLVPSRLQPGKFYALPQSPQLFKQILMASGFERYYQIAKCFRDEDLRADRQPEFTQLDIEMSFINEDMIMNLMEELWRSVVKEIFDIDLPNPFPRISYKEAMEFYGSDKPDLRFDMKLVDIADIAEKSEFQVFKNALEKKGRVKALRVPGGGVLSRKDIEDLTEWVKKDFKAGGLAWMKHEEEGLKSSITKFFSDELLSELIKRTNSKVGDILFFAADKDKIVHNTLGNLRIHLAKRFGYIPENQYACCWVVNFPLFERNLETGELESVHHPFTSPVEEDLELLLDDEKFQKYGENIRSRAYDMVINGVEVGGGSIRIHNEKVQLTALKRLGISEEEAREKFGFLLDALSFGAPPHGGIAFGLDRILALFLGRDSIRDVIAFPKTQRGMCLMSGTPSEVEVNQLQELRIRVFKT
ncbi:MAG: aspartate--tRNA ligase [Leptospiraceae bacterium]|nr:aspartate--tRNA ligase [Leptospiraceae bacterium]MDW7976276.1 aspartate--tRNA ligase [Leptospiraceae bacterium]